MSAAQEQGYLYRCAQADGATLRSLVQDLIGLPCWSFSAAILWDVEPDKKSANLRPISKVSDLTTLDIRGDFGHAFSQQAELRWKRRDAQTYDLLLLTEAPLLPNQVGLFGAQPLWEFPEVRRAALGSANLQDTPREERAQGIRYYLDRKEYRDQQGSVRFVRYTTLQKKQE